jgi:hypothetical protein
MKINENYLKNANRFIKEYDEGNPDGDVDIAEEYAVYILDEIVKEAKTKNISINEVDIDSIIRKVIESDDLNEHEPIIVDTLEQVIFGIYREVQRLAKKY